MRQGVTLLELLLVLVLSALLLGSSLSILGGLSRAVALGVDRWDRMEAVRTVWVTLERELRPGRPGIDWQVDPDGTLHLRAFRGFARACGAPDAAGSVPVAWRGERLPVPDRDSLVVLGGDGTWRPALLTRWREAEVGCRAGAGEREGWMAWYPAAAEEVVLARGFESGRYLIGDGAFRYARGGAGRQPLTPTVFATGSGFGAASGGLRVHLHPRPHPAGRSWGGVAESEPRSSVGGEAASPGSVRFSILVGEEY